MIHCTINGDIQFEYDIPKCKDSLFIWNINNDFICSKYADEIYFLNYFYFKILFNLKTNNIKLLSNNYNIFVINDIQNKINNSKKNLNDLLNEIDNYITNLNIDKISYEDVDTYNVFFNFYKEKYSLDFILKNLDIINKIINNMDKINKLDDVYIYNDDVYDIFYIELYNVKKNKKLNKLINSKKIESINITLVLLPSFLPKLKFLIDFENIIYDGNIQEIFKDLDLVEYTDILIEYINNEDLFNTVSNDLINNNNNIFKQIINLKLDSDNKDLKNISLYLNNLAILKN